MSVTRSDRKHHKPPRETDDAKSVAPTRPSPKRDAVDVASEDSFPASDAPSWTVVLGSGTLHMPH